MPAADLDDALRAARPAIDAAAHGLRLDADGAPPLVRRIAEPPAAPA